MCAWPDDAFTCVANRWREDVIGWAVARKSHFRFVASDYDAPCGNEYRCRKLRDLSRRRFHAERAAQREVLRDPASSVRRFGGACHCVRAGYANAPDIDARPASAFGDARPSSDDRALSSIGTPAH